MAARNCAVYLSIRNVCVIHAQYPRNSEGAVRNACAIRAQMAVLLDSFLAAFPPKGFVGLSRRGGRNAVLRTVQRELVSCLPRRRSKPRGQKIYCHLVCLLARRPHHRWRLTAAVGLRLQQGLKLIAAHEDVHVFVTRHPNSKRIVWVHLTHVETTKDIVSIPPRLVAVLEKFSASRWQ